ncbi:unnamed protein product [Trichobilharzia szidati]|nr:unnamed protein product [Trichobilharzia szidati]
MDPQYEDLWAFENTEESSPDTCIGKTKKWLKIPENIQLLLTILSVFLGVSVGLLIRYGISEISPRTIILVGFPGELLMNMLKMLIIPLVISTLIAGMANLGGRAGGKVGACTLTYYITTTFSAVILGIILVTSIRPGYSGIKKERGSGSLDKAPKVGTLDAILDLFRNIFPPNIVQACTQQTSSRYVMKPKIEVINGENVTTYTEVLETKMVDSTNILGLVTFSIVFGLIVGQLRDKGRVLLEFFCIVEDIIMRVVRLVMWFAPIGIFFLILAKIIAIKDLKKTATGLGLYMATVTIGLIIHLFIVLALLYTLILRKNPYAFFKGMLQAFLTALGTASSSATLPISLKCIEDKLKIDKRITRFVLPVGATINMDGTALYEAVASIFIAQVNDFPLTFPQIITISLTSTLAAIGAASVPSAGLVTMIIVLSSVGLPINDISLILTVDWILDRFRTSVNIMGDAYGAAIVEHLCRKEISDISNPSVQLHRGGLIIQLDQKDKRNANKSNE